MVRSDKPTARNRLVLKGRTGDALA